MTRPPRQRHHTSASSQADHATSASEVVDATATGAGGRRRRRVRDPGGGDLQAGSPGKGAGRRAEHGVRTGHRQAAAPRRAAAGRGQAPGKAPARRGNGGGVFEVLFLSEPPDPVACRAPGGLPFSARSPRSSRRGAPCPGARQEGLVSLGLTPLPGRRRRLGTNSAGCRQGPPCRARACARGRAHPSSP